MYVLSAFTSINTPKTPLNMVFNRKYFFFEQGLSYRCCDNGHGNAEKWLIKKWGEKETERLFFIEAAYNQIETSYECRDCIILSTEEYYEKIHERLYSKKDN